MRRGILASREELTALRERIDRRPYDVIYETLCRRCSLILETAPVTEPQWRSLWSQGAWASAVLAARTTQGRILDLIIAHHIESNGAYLSRAIEELKALVSWTTWVDPCHKDLPADLCTAEAAVAAVVGLDWLWEDLSEADRNCVLDAIQTKAIEPYRRGVESGSFWYGSCSNWNAVVNGGCGLAALALSDENPAADEALNMAVDGLDAFFNALGREGGWDEGTGYWGYAMRYLLLLGEALSRQKDDQRLLHRRGMDATGLFPVYFTPNGYAASFGDNPSVPLYGTYYLLARHFQLHEMTWWLDTYAFHRDVSTSGWSAAGLALLFRPTDAKYPQTPALEPLKVFGEIGWAAMADHWPRPGLYLAAKTGDLSASHSQHDMNSIQLQADGEMLLVDLGHAPYSQRYFSEARSEFYEVQARAHNTLVVAERDHCIDAQGSIVASRAGDDYRWVAMDSGEACGEGVQFIRHAVMIVDPAGSEGETLLVLDELDNPSPERVDVLWHTLGKIELEADGFRGIIRGRQAAVRFAFASTVPISVTTETHSLDSRRRDHVLKLTAGVVGKAYFVSAFTRLRAAELLQVHEDTKGIRVTYGEVEVSFTLQAHRLELATVARG